MLGKLKTYQRGKPRKKVEKGEADLWVQEQQATWGKSPRAKKRA